MDYMDNKVFDSDIEENIDITEEKNTDSLSPESTKNKKFGLRNDNRGIGVVEIVLILVGICIADKSRILCGNFRCI